MFRILKSVKTFMDTAGEWHATVIGWGDGVAFTTTDMKTSVDKNELLSSETHYYKAGLGIGRLVLVTTIIFSMAGAVALILKVIL